MSATTSLRCPGCKTTLRVRADLAGKKVKCPRCSHIVAIPAREEVVEVEEDFTEVAPIESPRKGGPVRRAEPEEEDRPRRRGAHRDAVQADEPARGRSREPERDWEGPRKKRRRDEEEDEGEERRPRSKYKPCPECGAVGATRVKWTPWGSFIGPALFCHVRCPECGCCYNGRSGRSNIIPIVLFVTVAVGGILGLLGTIFYMLHVKNYI